MFVVFKRLFAILVLLGLTTSALAQLTLPESGRVSLNAQWYLLPDPHESIAPGDLARAEVAERFKPQSAAPMLGYRSGAVWLRFSLIRPAQAVPEWWLELQSPTLDEATLYFPQGDGSYRSRTMGDRHPLAGRDMDYRNPLFRLDLPAGKPVTFYVRVKSQNALSIGLVLWSPSAFVSALGREQLAFGLFLAVHLVLILTNLWFFQATRDRTYGLFSLYTLTNLLTTLCLEGYAYQYLLRDMPAANESLLVVALFLATPISTLFLLHYMGPLRAPCSLWAQRALGVSWLVAFISIGLLLGVEQTWIRPFYLLWILFCSVLMLSVVIYLVWRGNRESWIILWAMLPFWLGLGLYIARNLGVLPPGTVTDNAYYTGMAIYLLALNYAVSRRFQSLRNEREAAKAEAKAASQRAERELEALVASRTQKLQETISQVETSLQLERRFQAEQREFFATVSHELRTPITVIDATAQNLEFDAEDVDEETRDRYEKILKATGRLSILLDSYLDEDRFALLRQGGKRTPCDLRLLLVDGAESAQLLADGHVFRIEADALPESFPCDPDLTRLVLRSLADNAVKYTPPGTEIRFCGRPADDGVLLDVVDTGPGISPEAVNRLFEPYFRGPNATKQPGSGLGLMLARRMIEIQGGTLTAKSELGKGSCFSVWLPLVGRSPRQIRSTTAPKL